MSVTPAIQLRPAAASDNLLAVAEAVADLPLLLRYGQPATRLEGLWRGAMAQGEHVWVAYAQDAACGVAWFAATGCLGLGGYLRLLAVGAAWQGRGIGEQLLRLFEQTTFASSRHAFLLVADFNAAAQKFYRDRGYRHIGAIPDAILPDVNELIYWKRRA